MSLKPAVPEHKHLQFRYGVTVGLGQFAFLYGSQRLEENFPELILFDRWGEKPNQFRFHQRDGKFAVFKSVDDIYVPESDGTNLTEMFRRQEISKLFKSVPLYQWSEGFGSYFDYLVAKSDEDFYRRMESKKPKHHVILDQRDIRGNLLSRKLLYSLSSRRAAEYALRQHRIWQEYLWQYYNVRDIFAESVFTKYRAITSDFDSEASSRATVLTEYPYSRGRKPPYSRHWHWHISRMVPLVEARGSENQSQQDREDERWEHRPGDPRILRETGSGYFGSYPAYEGDEEPEYRDENRRF